MKTLFTILLALWASWAAAQGDSLEYVRVSNIISKPEYPTLNDKIVKAAECLIGKPYVGGSLDNGANELLVVRLSDFDCVTFQETCLAMAKDAMSTKRSYVNFKRTIECLRYRNGRNTGYQSRLHYSTDWILDNTRRGNATDITSKLGGIRMTGAINFMSTHAQRYKALTECLQLVDSISARERYLTEHHVYYIPKDKVAGLDSKVEPGSLIFLTSANKSLGFAHVGIAIKENGVLKMIHASSSGHKVMKTPGSLHSYLMGLNQITGITVLTPR